MRKQGTILATGKTRIVKVNPSKRELLQSFSDTVHSYLDSPDVEAGLAHIEKALKDIKVLPFLIKHATTSQGDRTRQPTQDLQNAVVSFLEGLPPGSNVTTAQIAEAVNRTVAYVNVMLTAAVVGAGPKSPIQKVPTEPKKRARWTLTPPLSFNN